MTATQAMRYERREQQRRLHEKRVHDLIITLLATVAIVSMMCLAECGEPSDAELEAAEIAYWESQGITIVRDW